MDMGVGVDVDMAMDMDMDVDVDVDVDVDMDMDMAIFLLFQMVFGCFGYIETPKQAISILKRNNRKQTSCFG